MTVGDGKTPYLSHHVILSERQRAKDLPCIGMTLCYGEVLGLGHGGSLDRSRGQALRRGLRMTLG